MRGYWQAALTECSHSIAESGDRGMALTGHIMGNMQMKFRRLDRSEIPKGRTASTGASWIHRPPPVPGREAPESEKQPPDPQEHEESAGEQHGLQCTLSVAWSPQRITAGSQRPCKTPARLQSSIAWQRRCPGDEQFRPRRDTGNLSYASGVRMPSGRV